MVAMTPKAIEQCTPAERASIEEFQEFRQLEEARPRGFTPDQEAFLEKTAGHRIDFARLVVLGPLMAHRWRVEDPACPWPITVELWKREDGQRMMEMSIKAPAVQAAVAVAGFMAYLAEVGAERDREQQTKTRWALEYYAGKHGGGAGRAAAGARPRQRRRQGQP
jgi:hypothetical protein